MLRDDEAKDAQDTEEEVIDGVALLVHVGVLCGESRPQLRGYPGSEVRVPDPLEPLHLAEVVSMDFLGDFEAQVSRQLVDEHVKSGHVQTVIILQRLLYLEVQLAGDIVLRAQIVQEQKLFLECRLCSVVVGDQGTESARDQVERNDTRQHQCDTV